MDHQLFLQTSSGRSVLTVQDSDLMFAGASRPENKDMCALFIASWLALLSDSPVSLCGRKPRYVFTKFYKKLCVDLRGTILAYADLAHEFVSRHTLMGTGSSIGDWIYEFSDTPIFSEYHSYTKTCNPEIARYIYTFLNFGKKLSFVDESFYDVAFRDWLDVEDRLANLELGSNDLGSLRTIIRTVFPNRLNDELWPKHGPGHVADPIKGDPLSKHNAIRFDKIIDRFLFHGHTGKYGLGEDFGLSAERVIPNPYLWQPEREKARIPAHLLFVPKNMKTSRSICKEPTTLMFFQQGVMRQMYEAIRLSPFGSFIKLKDQSHNRRLANLGSYTCDIDTLDLSAASDSVHLDLVKKIFPTSWLIKMLATRSSLVKLPNGDLKRIAKFAPMGSALCFPTQCIIFASVLVYAATLYRLAVSPSDSLEVSPEMVKKTLRTMKTYYHLQNPVNLGSFPNRAMAYKYRLNPSGIYGDDICCDYRITAHVKSILTRLGFRVNDKKSFVSPQSFRESCGGFYLNGHDISPLYFTIEEVRRRLTPNHVASHVSLINEARKRGYKTLYTFLLHELRNWPVSRFMKTYSVPFISPLSYDFGVIASQVHNTHLEKTTNSELQREEWKVWTIAPVEYLPKTNSHEKYLYVRWWAKAHASSIDDVKTPSSHKPPVGYRIEWVWTPLY